MVENYTDADGNLLPNLPLFFNVSFTVIPAGLTPEHAQDLINDMKSEGGDYIPVDPETGRIKPEDMVHLTHIVATTADFPDYEEAINQMRHVVKPRWVDVSLTKNKLSNPRQFSPDPALFMSDVIVTFAKDIPEGDKEAIIGAVYAMGGQYSGSLSKLCTHLVALDTANERCRLVEQKNLTGHIKIVLPHWFDDCLKLGKRIKEHPYLLPNPEILKIRDADQPAPVAFREKEAYKDIKGASSPTPLQFPSPAPSESDKTRTLTVFRDKKIMLAADLSIGKHLLETLEGLIRGSGGELVTTVEQCDTYIGHFRHGQDYILAARANKDIGNICWLYYLIMHDAWTSPLRRLLHYPVPQHPIKGFENFKISISNYTGEARIYLESLVKAAGGEFTKTMKQDNTHLITAHLVSEKCDAAKEWNINLVNHLWLEESYARCEAQTLTNPRYTHFPSRTNLGEVIGQTRIDKAAVEAHYYPKPPTTLREAEMDPNVKHIKTVGAIVPSKRKKLEKAKEVSSGVQASSAVQPLPSADTSMTVEEPQREEDTTMNDVNDTTVITEPSELLYPPSYQTESYRPTPQAKKTRATSAKTPAADRFDGKENETPSTTRSRSAKVSAMDKLHESAADIALYEQERKRKGGVVYGGRRVSDPDRVDGKDTKRKRSSKEADYSEEEEIDVQPKGKKAKKAKEDVAYHLLLTAYEGFKGMNNKQENEAKNKLRNLGFHITENPNNCNIVCAPKIARTRKFVAALASAPHIVNAKFIDHCLKQNEIPPYLSDFALVDPEAENRFGFRLSDALDRAKDNNRKLMSGFQIFVTNGVLGGWDTFRDIINANGGNCYLYKANSRVDLVPREEPEDEALRKNRDKDDRDFVYMVSGFNNDEVALWKKFREMVKKQGLKPRIAMPDWVLQFAMTQEFAWEDRWELDESRVPAQG